MNFESLKTKIIVAIILVLLVILTIASVVSTVYLFTKNIGLEQALADASVTIAKLDFESVGQLVTQSCNVTAVKDFKDANTIFSIKIPFTQTRRLFSYAAKVDASVDFTKIKYEANDENREIVITLPHSEIYESKIDIESITNYINHDGWFNKLSPDEQKQMFMDLENDAKQTALNTHILTKADDNAKVLVSNIVKNNVKYSTYNVVFNYIGEENKTPQETPQQ